MPSPRLQFSLVGWIALILFFSIALYPPSRVLGFWLNGGEPPDDWIKIIALLEGFLFVGLLPGSALDFAELWKNRSGESRPADADPPVKKD